MTKTQKFFSALGRFFKNLFTKNLTLKITAFLFALLLWGYVLAIENPEYLKRVRDVEITINGEDTLNNRGLMLVTRDVGTTDVDIRCKISKHSELDASRVSCSIDLSTIANQIDADEDSKTVTVEVKANLRDSEYGTIEGTSVSSVEVTVARISSRSNVQVSVKTEGALADGFVCSLPENLTVSLRGQKSEVDRIARGEVTIDLSSFAVNDPATLAGSYDIVLPVQFYDSANVRLDDIVTSSGESVTTNVHVVIRAYKDVPIVPTVVTTEQFDELYDFECIPGQETIRLYGERSVLDTIESIGTETIFPRMGKSETNSTTRLIIPEGTSIDSTQTGVISYYLRVWERMSDGVEYEIPITYTAPKEELALLGTEPKTVTVRVTGTIVAMQSFNPSWITASVDVSNFAQGTYELPIVLTFSGNSAVYTVEPLTETIRVELILAFEPTDRET